MRRACVAAVVLAVTAGHGAPAHAYEFWLRAQTYGQGYQLRQYRLVGPDLFLERRRYTQTVSLRIFDIGGLSADRRRSHLPDRGLRISWQSYFRVDHDFGDYTSGRIALSSSIRRDAIDVIPELADSVAGLDLLYGYMELDGLVDDRLNIRLGRVLADDGWGNSGVDGGTAKLELPIPLAVSATAGLRVRASSLLGVSAYELDGTSGAGCQEYVEGATAGTGTWKLIDRNRMITNNRLASDYEYCPQREVRQPTIGAAISTTGHRAWAAEVGYRRTWSKTVGLIGPADRFANPDRGLYPNEVGQAPESGVNEERLYARAHADLHAGTLGISPYVNARFSLLHAAFDRADAGVRLARGNHVLEPALEYFLPTFDGDSIFNAFSIEPTTDVRLGYQYSGVVRGSATGWLRRYAHEDGKTSFAGGATVGVERPLAARVRARLDGLWDGGYGGRRLGGSSEVGWRARDHVWVRGRLIVLGVRPEDRRRYVTESAVTSATWQLTRSVGVHGIVELDNDEVHDFQWRAIGVLDLAFTPES